MKYFIFRKIINEVTNGHHLIMDYLDECIKVVKYIYIEKNNLIIDKPESKSLSKDAAPNLKCQIQGGRGEFGLWLSGHFNLMAQHHPNTYVTFKNKALNRKVTLLLHVCG